MCASLSVLYVVLCVRALGLIPVSLADFVVSQKKKFLRGEWGGREGEREFVKTFYCEPDPVIVTTCPLTLTPPTCPPDPHGQ